MKNIPEVGKCSICGHEYTHHGNNPEPLRRYQDRCCDDCNMMYVIPARMGRLVKIIGESDVEGGKE